MIPKNYQHVLAFVFAMNEVNKNPELLPNTSLTAKVLDNYFSAVRTSGATLDLLFLGKVHYPNYNCVRRKKVLAVIGCLTSQNSIQTSNILNTYKIPQVCVEVGRYSKEEGYKEQPILSCMLPPPV